jgi:putative DNA primase/helicase
MWDDLEIPDFLDRRPRPNADGPSQQATPHADASIANVGLSVPPADGKQSPAEQDGADEEVIAESKEKDSTVSDRSQPNVDQSHDAKQPDDVEIQRLSRLSPLQYDRERESAAKRLGIRVSVLDDQVNQARAANNADTKGQGRPISFPEPEPWPHSVDGAELLNGLCAALRRHVVISKEAADATALWVVHTYLLDALNTSPRLAITSPDKQCGKTTLLDILGTVTRCPLPTANATPAAIFRAIEMARPTLLIDEADTFLDNRSELRGILNSGHGRGTAYVLRTVGDDYEPRQFSTWAAMAIAKIGRLPATLEDRSIPVALRRRRPDEPIVSFRRHQADDLPQLARMAKRWCGDVAGEIGRATPVMPDGIHNRQADNWSPLLAIADVAGGEWPDRARHAAKTLVGAREDQSTSVMLLSDIRDLFDSRPDGKIRTKELLAGLAAIEGRPWSEWQHGKPISDVALARLLDPFEVGSVDLKLGNGKVNKGYRREHFEDAFGRYLPPRPPIGAATALLRASNGHNLPVSEPLPDGEGSACENSENCNGHGQSSGVAAVKASQSSANSASVPFMITHAQKDQLRERGFSDDQIKKLTPEEAHEILKTPADK